MPAPVLFRPVARASGPAALLVLLAACGERTPVAPAPQPQLVEPLEAAYRQFADPAMTVLEQSCDTAPVLAQSLGGWVGAVEAAGLQSRFARETARVKRRTAAIRARCPDTAAVAVAVAAVSDGRTEPDRRATPERAPDAGARPVLTANMLDAYARGLDEEIALMRASGSHFVSLSKYDEQGRQVAAAAGLSPSGYQTVRQAVHKVLYELMLQERYAGPAGQARLARLEPHKRKHAEEVLARDPYASLSAAERDLMRARLGTLQPEYARYMDLAAVGD